MAGAPKGLERLKRQLRALPEAVRREAGAELERRAAEMAAAVKRAAPVDDGDLRASIGSARSDQVPATRATGAFRPKTTERGEILASAGMSFTIFAGDDTAYYARWVEFGTAGSAAEGPRQNMSFKRTVVLTEAHRGHTATPAQPFFYPTIRGGKRKAKAGVARASNRAAKALAKVR